MTDLDRVQCQYCAHSFRPNKHKLVCRRYPPTYHPSHNWGQFPAVVADKSCGEYRPTETLTASVNTNSADVSNTG